MKATDRYLVSDIACQLNGRVMPVLNLSVGGFFIATDDPPIPGQVVGLELRLPKRPPFEVLAKVTWINRPDTAKARGLPLGFGVKITQIAFPHKLAILDLLKRSTRSAPRPD
jgi:Tfp pilus assembly protein PilZ